METEVQQKKPDNIDRCVKAALKVEKRLNKRVTYGNYMGLYHDKKPKIPRIKK